MTSTDPRTNPNLADLTAFLDASPSPFHAVGSAVERLTAARRQALDRLDAALLRRALSLTPAPPAVAAQPRLIAVWPLER